MFFTPKWKKEAKLLHKGALKFLHYKRDLLKPDRIDEIESRRADLLDAIKAGDIQVQGDQAKVEEFFGLLITYPFWFNIVTP